MSSRFFTKFQNSSVEELVKNLSSEFYLSQSSITKDLKDIAKIDQSRDHQKIDSDEELIALAELFQKDYPALSQRYGLSENRIQELKSFLALGVDLESVPPFYSEEEILGKISELFERLSAGQSINNFDFFGSILNGIPKHFELNRILKDIGSEYRVYIPQSENNFQAIIGKVHYESEESFQGASIDRIDLDIERQFNIDLRPDSAVKIDYYYHTVFIFRDLVDNLVDQKTREIKLDPQPYNRSVIDELSKIIQNLCQNDQGIDEISTALFWSQAVKVISIAREKGTLSGTISKYIGVGRRKDESAINLNDGLNLFEEKTHFFRQMIELQTRYPEKARRAFLAFIVTNYQTASSQKSDRVQPEYQSQMAALMLGYSVMRVDNGKIEIDWENLENRLNQIYLIIYFYHAQLENTFKEGVMYKAGYENPFQNQVQLDQAFDKEMIRQSSGKVDHSGTPLTKIQYIEYRVDQAARNTGFLNHVSGLHKECLNSILGHIIPENLDPQFFPFP